MKLTLRYGASFENIIVLSSQAKDDDIKSAIEMLEPDQSIDLCDKDGLAIQTELSSETLGYWLNMMRFSPDGEAILMAGMEGQFSKPQDVVDAFILFLTNDEKLESNYIWVKAESVGDQLLEAQREFDELMKNVDQYENSFIDINKNDLVISEEEKKYREEKRLESLCISPQELKNVDYNKYHIDFDNKILKYGSDKKTYLYRSFDEVLSVSVEVDGKTTLNTSLGGILGRAVVGSIFGGVGAVIGGVTAKKNEKTTIKKIKLTIDYLNGHTSSTITLYDSGCFCSYTPKDAERKANQIHDVIERHIMNRSSTNSPSINTGKNLPEQLASLADLHKQGLLSDEEFQSVKRKLISG